MIIILILLVLLIIYLLYMRTKIQTNVNRGKYMTILLIVACLFLLYKCITSYNEWNEYSKKINKIEKK